MADVAVTIQQITQSVAVTANETTEVVNVAITETVENVAVTVQEGGGGGYDPVITLTAGQNLSTGRVVIVDAGKAWYFQNTNAAHHGRAYGITTTSATTNGSVMVAISGIVEDSAFGFAADTVLWVGADGEIFNVQPVTGVIFQKAGVASGAKKMRIDFSLSTYKN